MIPIVIYTAISAVGIVYARTIGPEQVLHSEHHRRIYWTGAVAAVGLVIAFASPLIN